MKKQKPVTYGQPPISAEAISQLENILTGCRSGRLLHKQSTWHCGSAHCVAGWNTVLNHRAAYDKAVEVAQCDTLDIDDGRLAKEDWGLNNAEANYCFIGDATFEQQFGLLEFLRAGHRLPNSETDYRHIRVAYDRLREFVDAYEYPAPSELVEELLKPAEAQPEAENAVVLEQVLEQVEV